MTENEQLHLNNQRVRELIDSIKVLRKEVDILESRVQEHATGHLHTAIGVINGRIDEMVQELTAPFFEDEDRCPYSNAPDPDAINFNIPKEDDSDAYDTFDSLPG